MSDATEDAIISGNVEVNDANPAPAMTKVILIHGTGAADPLDKGNQWWQEGSDFWKELNVTLVGFAHCSGPVFHWNGANSERERRNAAESLLRSLMLPLEGIHAPMTSESSTLSPGPYYLVGHSHGGSVIRTACLLANQRGHTLKNLQGVSTVGTPYLDFRTDRAALLLLLPLAAVFASIWHNADLVNSWFTFVDDLFDTSQWLTLLGVPLTIALLVVIAVLLLFRILRTLGLILKHEARDDFIRATFGRRWQALWTQDDEALAGIRVASSVRGSLVPALPYAWPGEAASLWVRLVVGALIPLVAIVIVSQWAFNRVLVRYFIDPYFWTILQRRAQGCDLPGHRLSEISPSPDPAFPPPAALPTELQQELTAKADQILCISAAGVRQSLAQAGRDLPGDLRTFAGSLGRGISLRELVHCCYFLVHGVRQQIYDHLRKCKSAMQSTPDSRQAYDPNAEHSLYMPCRLGLWASLATAIPHVAALLAICGVMHVLLATTFENQVAVYTPGYQLEAIIQMAPQPYDEVVKPTKLEPSGRLAEPLETEMQDSNISGAGIDLVEALTELQRFDGAGRYAIGGELGTWRSHALDIVLRGLAQNGLVNEALEYAARAQKRVDQKQYIDYPTREDDVKIRYESDAPAALATTIAVVCAQSKNPDGARIALQRVTRPANRVRILSEIAYAGVTFNKPANPPLVEELSQSLASVEDTSIRAQLEFEAFGLLAAQTRNIDTVLSENCRKRSADALDRTGEHETIGLLKFSDPSAARAQLRINLCAELAKRGHFDDALEQWQTAVSQCPDFHSHVSRREAAEALAKACADAKQIAKLKTILPQDDDHRFSIYEFIAPALAEVGALDLAVEYYAAMVAIADAKGWGGFDFQGHVTEPQSRILRCLLEHSRFEEAEKVALTYPKALKELGSFSSTSGKPIRRLEDLDFAELFMSARRKEVPSFESVAYELFVLRSAAAKQSPEINDRQVFACQQNIDNLTDGDHVRALALLGEVLADMGRRRDARRILKTAITESEQWSLGQEDGPALVLLTTSLAHSGMWYHSGKAGQMCTGVADRLAAFTGIVQEMAAAKSPR